MTRPIRFDPAAQRELNEAADFYDAEDPGLGGVFLDAIKRAIKQTQAFPESSPISLAPVRTKVLSAFPFSVIYWVTDDAIIVLAVAHHHRQPGYWRGRK
jgi:plasmid stabilization system protein ParE